MRAEPHRVDRDGVRNNGHKRKVFLASFLFINVVDNVVIERINTHNHIRLHTLEQVLHRCPHLVQHGQIDIHSTCLIEHLVKFTPELGRLVDCSDISFLEQMIHFAITSVKEIKYLYPRLIGGCSFDGVSQVACSCVMSFPEPGCEYEYFFQRCVLFDELLCLEYFTQPCDNCMSKM